MTTGIVILLVVAVIVYAGFAHRALDRLRLSDKAALVFLVAMLIGGFLPDLMLGRDLGINIGGGIIPLILVGYLFSKAESWEIGRTVLAVLIATAVVYGTIKIMPLEPTYNFFLDPLYLIAIVAGLVAYLAGRSRRGAFIAGVLAIIFSDLLAFVENSLMGVRAGTIIGGAGFFDAVVISGFIALGLAELFGETAERFAPLLGAKTRGELNDEKEDNREREGGGNEGE